MVGFSISVYLSVYHLVDYDVFKLGGQSVNVSRKKKCYCVAGLHEGECRMKVLFIHLSIPKHTLVEFALFLTVMTR